MPGPVPIVGATILVRLFILSVSRNEHCRLFVGFASSPGSAALESSVLSYGVFTHSVLAVFDSDCPKDDRLEDVFPAIKKMVREFTCGIQDPILVCLSKEHTAQAL